MHRRFCMADVAFAASGWQGFPEGKPEAEHEAISAFSVIICAVCRQSLPCKVFVKCYFTFGGEEDFSIVSVKAEAVNCRTWREICGMRIFSFRRPAGDDAEPVWCVRGAMSVFYFLVGIYFIYVTVRYLTVKADGDYMSAFWFIHGPVHEIGHFFFSPRYFPMVIHLLAGTVFQILTPVICGIQFVLRQEFPPLAVLLGWFGFAVLDASVYMKDARRLELPLVSPFSGGGEIIHDWNWLFDYFGCLHQADRIAGITAFFGYLFAVLSILLIFFMLIRGLLWKNTESAANGGNGGE